MGLVFCKHFNKFSIHLFLKEIKLQHVQVTIVDHFVFIFFFLSYVRLIAFNIHLHAYLSAYFSVYLDCINRH